MKKSKLISTSFALTIFTALGIGISQTAEATSLWKFDEQSGSTALDSLGANDGTYKNGLLPTNGIATFDGFNDYVDVPDNATLDFGTADLLVSARIKTTSRQLDVIVDKRVEQSGPVQGFVFFLGQGNLGFQLADGNGWTNYGSNAFVADGEWHDIAVTVDRDKTDGGQFYLDGMLAGTFNPTGRQGSLNNSIDLTIGRRSDSSNLGSFTGSLDNVCVAQGTDLSVCEKKSVPEPSSLLGIVALGTFGAILPQLGKRIRKTR